MHHICSTLTTNWVVLITVTTFLKKVLILKNAYYRKQRSVRSLFEFYFEII